MLTRDTCWTPWVATLLGCLLALGAACGDDAAEATTADASEPDVAASDVGVAIDAPVEPPCDLPTWQDASFGPTGERHGPAIPAPTGPLGGDRPVEAHLPAAWDGVKTWPVFIFLHGFSLNSFFLDAYLGMSGRVDELGAVILIPDATVNPDGDTQWNAHDFEAGHADDVAYLRSLIDESIIKLAVDPRSVYLVGHSNGGYMVHRMACEVGERVAGVLSLAGAAPPEPVLCEDTGPVTILHVHGTDDASNSYPATDSSPGAVGSTDFWAERLSCPEPAFADPPIDLVIESNLAGAETSIKRWCGCDGGTSVALWTIEGGNHNPFFSEEFLSMGLRFLVAHPKQPQ